MSVAVYCITGSSIGPSKVGVADDVVRRLAGVQSGNPRRLYIHFAALVPTRDEAFRVESAVIRRLSKKKLIGEWFNVKPWELRVAIIRECKRDKIAWSEWETPEKVRAAAQLDAVYAEARQLHQEIGGRLCVTEAMDRDAAERIDEWFRPLNEQG